MGLWFASIVFVFFGLSAAFELPTDINFEPFRSAIQAVVAKDTAARDISGPVLVDSKTDQCVMPTSSIMFTYTSHYMIDLVLMQRRAMEIHKMRHCLEKNFITVCVDKKCHTVCTSNDIPNCVLLEMPELPGSDFGKAAYNFFTYLKHELMYEALKVVEEVFFFDADCVIFRNPWVDIQFRRIQNGDRVPEKIDLQFQRDRGRGPSCYGSVNTGQVYIRNSTRAQNYLQGMRSKKEVIIKGSEGLDQDFVGKEAEVANMTVCALSTALYAGGCPTSRTADAPVGSLVTFHTSCVEGLERKRNTLNHIFNAVRNSPHSKLGMF